MLATYVKNGGKLYCHGHWTSPMSVLRVRYHALSTFLRQTGNKVNEEKKRKRSTENGFHSRLIT